MRLTLWKASGAATESADSTPQAPQIAEQHNCHGARGEEIDRE
jgi:hypothetical protein